MQSYRFELHGVTRCLQKETYQIYLHFITHYTIDYAMYSPYCQQVSISTDVKFGLSPFIFFCTFTTHNFLQKDCLFPLIYVRPFGVT